MRTSLACATVILAAGALPAQSRVIDFSGHWRLVEPTAAERAGDTLAITSPDQLLITQNPSAIIVEHPSNPGTHPEAGTFTYGEGGRVGGLPGGGNSIDEKWGVTHIGTQLMISRSTTSPPDGHGVRVTPVRGSMWRLDGSDRLIIEFSEERTGNRPKIARRVYVKMAPHTQRPYCTQYSAARRRSLIGGCV
jgi:hypothetical protein